MEDSELIEKLQKQSSGFKEGIAALRTEVNNTIAATKSVFDESIQSTDSKVAHLAKTIQSLDEQLNGKFDALKVTDQAQTLAIEELEKADRGIEVKIEKVTTQCQSNTSRLNGDIEYSSTKQIPIEQMRANQASQQEMLEGGIDRMAYPAVRATAQNITLIKNVMLWAIGTFGAGAVVAAVSSIFGLGKPVDLAPKVAAQEQEIINLKKDLQKAENRFDEKIKDLKDAVKK